MKDEIYALTYELEERYWWYVARRKVVMAQVENILKLVGTAGCPRLLDYGCGTGLNLLHLANLGDAYGLDSSEIALDFCRRRGIENVIQLDDRGGGQTDNPFDQPFQVVTMLDVLEHIPNDELALRQVSGLLAPGGVLLVTVPAFEFLWSGEDFVSGHQRRYSRRSLIRMFHNAGYEVLKASYFNFFLFPMQVAVVLWKRLLRPRSMYRTNLSELPWALDSLLTAIMSSEAGLLRICNLPIGGSIVCWGRVAGATAVPARQTGRGIVAAEARPDTDAEFRGKVDPQRHVCASDTLTEVER